MHRKLVALLVEQVRLRESQGDCPTEPALPVETLENLVLALATPPAPAPDDARARALEEAAKVADNQAALFAGCYGGVWANAANAIAREIRGLALPQTAGDAT